MSNSLFENLQLKDDRSLLIQGIPSSIEKQFIKLSYAKNVTPLLRSKKIDFALIFAINQSQLNNILKEVFVALHVNSKLWISYPKQTSKIVSDLNRDCSWDLLVQNGFENMETIAIDNVWNAILFKKSETTDLSQSKIKPTTSEHREINTPSPSVDFDKKLVVPPAEIEKIFKKHKEAKEIFTALSEVNQNEYVTWIEGAKREETKQRRLDSLVEKLTSGKKSPLEK